jgi:thiamine transport system ATP-binding protein
MLSLEGVTIHHPGFHAVYQLSVEKGAFVAIIGPSGGGKTTLFNALSGFETLAGGTMRYDGDDFTHRAPAARPSAMLFQDHNLFPHLDARTNVGLGIDPGLRLSDTDWRRVHEALEQVGLAGFGQRLPGALSGGQRQRVALARALVRNKPLLLLDEPFGALDPGLRKDMMHLVDALRRARGFTVLMSLHTPDDALSFADRMIFIAEGRVQMNDAPDVVLTADAPMIRQFLGR